MSLQCCRLGGNFCSAALCHNTLMRLRPTCAVWGKPSKLGPASPVLGVLAAPDLGSNIIVSVPIQDVLDGPFEMLCALCCLV